MIGNDKTRGEWERWICEALIVIANEIHSEEGGELKPFDLSGDAMWGMLVDKGCDEQVAKDICEETHEKVVSVFPKEPLQSMAQQRRRANQKQARKI